MKEYVYLGDICKKGSSNIAQKDLENKEGEYNIYGAGGLIKKVDFYHQKTPYIAVVKDGAGVGRTMLLPAYSSVIGTMQYIIPSDKVDINYLYYAITYMNLSKYYMGAAIPHIYFKDYQSEKLPLPDINAQRKISNILHSIDTVIRLYKDELDVLDKIVKSRFIELFRNYDLSAQCSNWQRIDEIGVVIGGATPKTNIADYWNGEYLWITPAELAFYVELYIKCFMMRIVLCIENPQICRIISKSEDIHST